MHNAVTVLPDQPPRLSRVTVVPSGIPPITLNLEPGHSSGIVAVHLYLAVFRPYLGRPVEAIIAVSLIPIIEQVADLVMGY
jgi:hypothetical protein